MDDKTKIDDFVSMMDRIFESGGGHVNIIADNTQDDGIAVQTFRSSDCGCGNKACCEPTVHTGIDDDTDN